MTHGAALWALVLSCFGVGGLLSLKATGDVFGGIMSVARWGFILLALPALAVSMHSVAGLYCIAVVGILLFWGRLGAVGSWLAIILMFCLFLAAWKLMGFDHSPDAAETTINKHLALQWWKVAVWFIVGLGFRIVALRWISRPLKDPVSVLVLATFVGLLAFSLALQLQLGAERYGIYFLQGLFSIFAFSRLTPGCWRGVERSLWVSDWLRLAKKGLILLTTIGVLIGTVAYATHSHTGIAFVSLKILLSLLMLSIFAGASATMKRSLRFSAAGAAILMGIRAFEWL